MKHKTKAPAGWLRSGAGWVFCSKQTSEISQAGCERKRRRETAAKVADEALAKVADQIWEAMIEGAIADAARAKRP
jgi:hypothetical protein